MNPILSGGPRGCRVLSRPRSASAAFNIERQRAAKEMRERIHCARLETLNVHRDSIARTTSCHIASRSFLSLHTFPCVLYSLVKICFTPRAIKMRPSDGPRAHHRKERASVNCSLAILYISGETLSFSARDTRREHKNFKASPRTCCTVSGRRSPLLRNSPSIIMILY